ncbi:sporulation protein [Streptomyces sp. HSW2009]|uniref:sporulation protein n=1 Tax=Streptomyces sp. HSW2009 TaxID=3142890 RepID=UPI0032EFC0AA
MVFKRLLGAIGVGGPSVDTVLDEGPVLPGAALTGRVRMVGGTASVEIEHVTLELVAHVEAEGGDEEREGLVAFHRATVDGGFRLADGEEREVPFTLPLPWELPVTELHGQGLGVVLGLRTELAVAGAKDKGDLDPLRVRPLPIQEAVLEAFGQLGYGFTSADLELGHIHGTSQSLPFYQEIELSPPPQHAHALQEVEVTFLATPVGMEVVLEADRRGGPFTAGGDAVSRFTVAHQDVERLDWTAAVDSWLRGLIERRGGYAEHAGHAEHGAYGSYGGEFGSGAVAGHSGVGHGASEHGHRSGPSTGAVVAGVAAGVAVGVVGGFVAAEVIDEIGDAFEDDDEEGGED